MSRPTVTMHLRVKTHRGDYSRFANTRCGKDVPARIRTGDAKRVTCTECVKLFEADMERALGVVTRAEEKAIRFGMNYGYGGLNLK